MTDTKADKTKVSKAKTSKAAYPCKPLGKAIKAARTRKDIRQKDLQKQFQGNDITGLFRAIKVGSKTKDHTNTVTQYETGRRTPSPDRLRRLAFCLGVTTDELLGMYDERFFYRIIHNLACQNDPNYIYNADLTLSDEVQSEDEWPNKENRKLNLQVTVTNANNPPYQQTLTPNIGELKKIQEISWMQYENDLKRRIDNYLYAHMLSDDKTLLSDLSLYIALTSLLALVTDNEEIPASLTYITQSTFAKMITNSNFYSLCNDIQKENEPAFTVFGKKICTLILFFYFTGIDPLEHVTALILHGLKKRADAELSNNKEYDFRQSFHKGIHMINEQFLNKDRKDWSQKKYDDYNKLFHMLYEHNWLTDLLKTDIIQKPNEYACHELILNAARSFCSIPIVSYDDTENRMRHFSEMNCRDLEDLKYCLLGKLIEADSDFFNRCEKWEPNATAPDYIWFDLIEECEKIRKELTLPAHPEEGKPKRAKGSRKRTERDTDR
jgi:transcriptional regulator with XRE-family HTH domain